MTSCLDAAPLPVKKIKKSVVLDFRLRLLTMKGYLSAAPRSIVAVVRDSIRYPSESGLQGKAEEMQFIIPNYWSS